jgi:hypothetical protein
MSTMQRDGEYRAWFRTSRGAGTGVVYLVDGKISGGDCFFDYSGSYQVEDDRFTATLTTRRRVDGPTTVFGVDEIEAKLTGLAKGRTIWCCGAAEQAPDLQFEVTLFPGLEQPVEPPARRVPATSNAARLAEIPSTPRRTRNPFSQRQ